MRKRFPWTGLLAALALAAVLVPLLTALLPRTYGRALDLTCGRELEFEELLGIRLRAEVRSTVLSERYKRHVGPLPAEHNWQVLWTDRSAPRWLSKLLPQPPPRPLLMTGVVVELVQLTADNTYGAQRQSCLSEAARGAAIERTLTIVELSGDPQLALDYVRGINRQLDDWTKPLEPAEFLTAEQYLAYIARGDPEQAAQ